MSDTERITVRLPNESVRRLQTLVDQGDYSTVSEAIRAAIDAFIDTTFTPDHIERVTVELPKGNVIELNALVKEGDSVSIDDAIRNAVREYTRNRVTKALREME